MSLQRKELNLIAVMATALMVMAGFFITKKKMPVINDIRNSISQTEENIAISQNLLDQRDPLLIEQAKLGARLPVFPTDLDVKADLFSTIERLAGKAGLRLPKLEAEGDEEQLGDAGVYQFKISCTFIGTGESLLQFLYATQREGALDVSYLRSQPEKRRAREGIVNGRFTVDCAYRRQKKVTPKEQPKPAEPAPAEDPSEAGETS